MGLLKYLEASVLGISSFCNSKYFDFQVSTSVYSWNLLDFTDPKNNIITFPSLPGQILTINLHRLTFSVLYS